MYVPGRIKDLDNFVIDVGTGYYVEKVIIFSYRKIAFSVAFFCENVNLGHIAM